MTDPSPPPETPDDSIPQDPAIPGPGTKEGGEWPPESGTAASSAKEGFVRDPREEHDTKVSEAIDREPRHRREEKPESGSAA